MASGTRDRGVGGAAEIPGRSKSDDLNTLYVCLAELVIALPDNVADLEQTWRDNRHAFWRMQTERPQMWQALVDLATARKKVLAAGGHLTPETGTRQHQPIPSRPFEAARHLQGE